MLEEIIYVCILLENALIAIYLKIQSKYTRFQEIRLMSDYGAAASGHTRHSEMLSIL